MYLLICIVVSVFFAVMYFRERRDRIAAASAMAALESLGAGTDYEEYMFVAKRAYMACFLALVRRCDGAEEIANKAVMDAAVDCTVTGVFAAGKIHWQMEMPDKTLYKGSL